jgi:hypothetical protein
MKIPARWREYVKGCADGAPPTLQRRAINLLAEDRESRQRVSVKAAPRVKAKTEKRDGRNARMARIRMDVFNGSGGNCAAKCATPIRYDTFHAHHVIGGGERQAKESVKTVAPLCGACHEKVHAGDLETLVNLRWWAQETGRREAMHALERRIAKVEEARRAA